MARAEFASPLTLFASETATLENLISTTWGMDATGIGGSDEGGPDDRASMGENAPGLGYGHRVDLRSVGTLDIGGELLDFGQTDNPSTEVLDLPIDGDAVDAATGGPSTESDRPHRAPDAAILPVVTDSGLDREATGQSIPDHGETLRQARTGHDGVWYDGPREITIVHDGLERSFIVDVPPGFDPGQSYSAVFAFHGANLSAGSMMALTGLSELADQGNFLAVYPSAADDQWNDGRVTTEDGIDDVGFVQAIIAELEANWGLDAGRVYATGVSSGGMFVQRLALEAAEDFEAFAVVAANLPEHLAGSAGPGDAAPIVFFEGTEDLLMPFEGGAIPGGESGHSAGGTVLSAEETVEFWATANGTALGQTTYLPDTVDDGTTVSVRASEDGSTVEYVIEGGGHNWPGMDMEGLTEYTGTVSQEVDATEIMVDFFEDYGL